MELPAAHLAEVVNEVVGVLLGQLACRVSQCAEPVLQACLRSPTVPVLLGGSGEQFPADEFQVSLHLPVADETQLSELVDEVDEGVSVL